MSATEDPVLQQPALLSCGQLPLAGRAGEAGQVERDASSSSHPVAGVNVAAAASAARPILPEVVKFAENLFVFDVAAHMTSQ